MNSILSYFKIKALKKSMVDSEPEVPAVEQNQQHERQIDDIEEEKYGGVQIQIADAAGETVGGEPDLDTT